MANIYINARCKKILYLLLSAKEYMPLSRIAEETNVSKRSIYYDLCKINEWLTYYGIPELLVKRGKGIYICTKQRQCIEGIIEQERGEESYIFSPMERVKITICYIVRVDEPVYIERLTEFFQVSRNTVFNDLRIVVNKLQEYNLKLVYESKRGYQIEGDIIRKRALYFYFYNTLKPLFESGVLNFEKDDKETYYYEKLKKIEKELEVEYVDGILQSLAALLPVMYKTDEKPYFPNVKMEEIEKTQEYALVKKWFGDLNEKEQVYLCLHLLGSRVTSAGDAIFEEEANQTVYEITKALVAEFEKLACVVFEDKEKLERGLFLHINSSLYRYQYGIQIGNAMCDDIKREYANLFNVTRHVCHYLEEMVGLPIPDSEVAYLSLHFGAQLRIAEENNQLRILIVCVNGVSTGNMLKHEVKRLLPHARIVDVVAAMDVVNIQNICDLVISTVRIKSMVPVLVVHPILTDLDRQAILNVKLSESKQILGEKEELFQVMKQYIRKEDYEDVKTDIERYLKGKRTGLVRKAEQKEGSILGYLEHNRIQVTDQKMTWQEAVFYAGRPLLEAGSIERRYLQMINSQIRYYGPYMLITKLVLLAHAKPEDGVNTLDVSMSVFKKPILFPNHQEAQIIITLAVEDQEKHLGILKDIMAIFGEEDVAVRELIRMPNSMDMLSYIKEKVEKERIEEKQEVEESLSRQD